MESGMTCTPEQMAGLSERREGGVGYEASIARRSEAGREGMAWC